ncbi:unnamed protein product [Hymenolepis diminuta]|uniref:Uncharacterized protein n=1 Tax=Hymenolepis diminuta TaxID=6216 RepID=A0A564ZDW3_HYMDI|nr:unnamed protein product [Hymenolepis diminuta]
MSLVKEVEKLLPEERRKITELIKAKEDQSDGVNGSKPDASTSWMYEQPKRSGEDFLLGKAIKSLEELTEINRDQEEETPTQRLTRLDMEAKFREDPLNLMRQHEMDKRSALLQNTARMKKLQKLIVMQNAAKEKMEKRKKKRLKKEHKKQKRSISESSTSSSEDDEILEKFISLIKKVDEVKNDENGGCSVSEKSKSKKNDEKEKKHKHKIKHHHDHHSSNKGKKSSESPKPSEDHRPKVIPGRLSHSLKKDDRSRHRSGSVSPKKISDKPPSRRHDDDRDRYRRRSPRSSPRRYRSPPRRQRSRSRSRSHDRGKDKRKLPTQEEMAALREQMAADAKEREAERVKRFELHRNEMAKEENEEGQARVSHGASFLRGLTLKHVASTSVEEVVQRNANKRQRGGMDQNFLRK